MNAINIIEAFNQYIDVYKSTKGLDKKGHFVLLKTISMPSTFTKSIKSYLYTVYYVKANYKVEVLKLEKIDKSTTTEMESKLINELDNNLLVKLFNMANTEVILDLILNKDKDGSK